jgi:hypothetical protein
MVRPELELASLRRKRCSGVILSGGAHLSRAGAEGPLYPAPSMLSVPQDLPPTTGNHSPSTSEFSFWENLVKPHKRVINHRIQMILLEIINLQNTSENYPECAIL